MFPKFEDFIFSGLNAAYEKTKETNRVKLTEASKFVVFSDHHKGARDGGDMFLQCEANYLSALDYYYEKGYTLVILGDAEELWKDSIQTVLNAYRAVMKKEAQFHADKRYIKVFGNHDDKWRKERNVKKHLHPIFPGLKVHEGLLLDYAHPDTQANCEILFVHGHQGTFDSDRMRFWARILVWFYKYYQILTGKGKTSPSRSNALRARHDRTMYLWSTQKGRSNFILVTGHTHRPVWSSQTHVEKLAQQLKEEKKDFENARKSSERFGWPEMVELIQRKLKTIASLSNELKRKMDKYHSDADTLKTFPTYFNTGCCRFSDGDVTAIEIENGVIRLVKWEESDSASEKTVFEEDQLSNLFTDVDYSSLIRQTTETLELQMNGLLTA